MAGRPRGSLNKKTEDLFDLCTKERINPFQALLKLCKHEDVTIRLPALTTACKYLYPVRKAIEMSGPGGGPIESSSDDALLEEFREFVKHKSGAKT